VQAASAIRSANKHILIGSLKKAKPEVIETAEEKTSRLLLENDTRALTHALYVAEGVTPETVSRVVPVASLARRATQLLGHAGIPVGASSTTIRRDLLTAGELMVEHLKKAFKGLKFALVTDGATFKDSGKGIAIVLSSSGLKQSVLLVLEHPDALGVYDHKKLAADVREVLLKYDVNLKTQVVFLLT
jgi:hypothetical protein